MSLAGMEWFPAIWIGGSLFGFSIFLAGYLTPGYSHSQQSISELGVRNMPWSWLIRYVGFIPLGLSFALFAQQTQSLFSNSVPSLLFLLIGIAILSAGIVPTDPHNGRDTFSGKVHAAAVLSLVSVLTVAPFVLSIPTLYRDAPATWFFAFSISMGTITLGFLLILPKSENPALTTPKQRTPGELFSSWRSLYGLHQRIFVSLHSVWWLAFSFVLESAP